MKVLVDTREKPHAIRAITDYFDLAGIEWERRALKTGDYMLDGRPGLAIDRKQSLQEMAQNLLSRDRARFYREVRRARETGVRLVILCEHGPEIRKLEDVRRWEPQFGQVRGKALCDAIARLEIGYGVPTFYCDKRDTGARIIQLLGEYDGQDDGRV